MKSLFKLLIISIFYLLMFSSLKAETGSAGHHHGHAEDGASRLVLNQGSKWKTDIPLRQGMQKINDAFMKLAPAFHNDTLTKKDGNKLARHINEQVEYLINNCKLESEADSALHVLIADLLQGADVLAKKPLSMDGMPKIHKALMLYPDYFDHSGW